MKPRILVFIDTPGWSADVTCSAVMARLKNEFNFSKRAYPYRLRHSDRKFDLIYVHCSYGIETLMPGLNIARSQKWPTKFATGARGHYGYARSKTHLAKFDALNASSLLLLNILRRDFPNKPTYLCHCGVDVHLFRPLYRRRRCDPFTVGWAGNSSNAAKRCERLKQLPYPIKIADFRKQLGGKHYPHSEMPQFYNSLDVLVLVSDVEGCPMPTVEAAACARCVVSTPVGSIREWLPEHWQVKNTVDMTARLRELEKSHDLRQQVGRQLRELVVEKFSWSKVIKEYRAFFNGVVR